MHNFKFWLKFFTLKIDVKNNFWFQCACMTSHPLVFKFLFGTKMCLAYFNCMQILNNILKTICLSHRLNISNL